MRRFALAAAVALAALPVLAAAQQQQQQQEGSEETAGRPKASYAAHLAVWAEKCGLDAAELHEAVAGTAEFEETVESYRAEVQGAECTEARRAETAALLEEFTTSTPSAR